MIDTPPLLAPLVDGIRAPFTRPFETTRSTPAKDWTLFVSKDRFTGALHCRLQSRGFVYDGGVLTFQFGHSVDTANAMFRVDGAPARSVGDVAVEAAGRGANFMSRNTRNPSDGAVRLPASQLDGHQSVAIRPNVTARVRTYSLVGFSPALSAAKAQGCPV